LFDALMKDVISLLETRLSKEYVTELHHDALSSISFTSESSFDAFRSRKRARKMISSISRKRIKLSEKSCDYVMSSRWREILTQVNLIKSIKSAEHRLDELYYLKRQVCRRHINKLKRLYELLSMKDLSEMKNIL
jgi:DNA-directed RNA polymerase subunit N (RpoN/RPB10)